MLDFGYYNMGCMDGMKEFPDKYFDLAVVDPPYGSGFTEGGGCAGWFEKYKPTQNSGGGTGTDSARGSTDTKFKARHERDAKRAKASQMVELVRRKQQKNHSVGCSPETRILQRIVSHLTEPSYLGGATTLNFRQHAAF